LGAASLPSQLLSSIEGSMPVFRGGRPRMPEDVLPEGV
jgi:hypothetical protein